MIQTDVRSNEFSDFIVALDEFIPSDPENLSVGNMGKQLQQAFIDDIQKFLNTYTPVYNDAKEVFSATAVNVSNHYIAA